MTTLRTDSTHSSITIDYASGSGFMPVGYQHGFIFEQFDVARTIAHVPIAIGISHGAFALHHTFSANTESFRADEGTTTNLMDYTESGTTLNHKQWTWMHEKHGSGLFGFLADISNAVDNEAKIEDFFYTIKDMSKKDWIIEIK